MSSREKHRAAESQAGLFDLEYFYELKKYVIDCCMKMNLIAKEYVCPTCGVKMVLTERDVSDGYSCVCRKFGVNAHHVRRTVRKGSWFDEIALRRTGNSSEKVRSLAVARREDLETEWRRVKL
ncbi:hypothetical protein AVEN_242579-1 [Araneus ventricosus]|uniref:Uncharacterized protein n=1 Tax=Araneus ventricosus TaxID=182803 RepID=A0A4Y2TAU3_ARAVE|nr:hypothetical protein AVEN_242579-1 [Araneus ventricosus]